MGGIIDKTVMYDAASSNKCFIQCPAEDNAEDIIFCYRLQDEYKLEIIWAG
jgi:hypothetical protein